MLPVTEVTMEPTVAVLSKPDGYPLYRVPSEHLERVRKVRALKG
jgi:hypothetical protein